MPLAAGLRLGPYEILGPLGSGGMGEVYRARDTTLGRDVAIKVLSADHVQDAEFRARFEREARLISQLNHANICALYHTGTAGESSRSGQVPFLVLELVEGETLRERLIRGPIPLAETLRYGLQIAEALEAAHERGVIHRDLKPANVKITPAGTVKVLDFGLAKLENAVEPVDMPTMTLSMTRNGVVLGTAAYMSPEQARGLKIDKRTDVWAFGCVLYEMLSGRRAFDGERTQEVVARVIEREPDFAALPQETPPALRRLLRRVLTKDPRKRLADVSDARLDLEEATAELMQPVTGQPAQPTQRFSFAASALLGSVIVAVISAFLYARRGDVEAGPVRFTLAPPAGVTWAVPNIDTVLAVSPDGRSLAYTGRGSDARTSLWLRSLDSLESRPLPGTTGAVSPFWSPDSRSIGFFADGKLKRIDVSGGAVTILCDAVNNRGGTWGPDGVIVFARIGGPLQKVSDSGGIPSPASALAERELYHSRPIFLPGSRRFIYRVDDPSFRGNRYYVSSLDSMERKLILRLDSGNLAYSKGHLFFVREESTLMAQPFDVERLTLSGEQTPIVENLRTSAGNRPLFGVFSLSQTGVLAYLTGSGRLASRVVWLDRAGKEVDVLAETGDYLDVALSPDGARAAVTQYDDAVKSGEVWLFDVQRRLATRLTSNVGDDGGPVWSEEGALVFGSNQKSRTRFAFAFTGLYQVVANGVDVPKMLIERGGSPEIGSRWTKYANSLSRDGRFLLYEETPDESATHDLWVLPTGGTPRPFVSTQFHESQAQFSPDGQWVAYTSNQSGRSEVYVTSFPNPDNRYRISTSGGVEPRWRDDGREIFYLAPDSTLTAVSVAGGRGTFRVGEVNRLFHANMTGRSRYDVAADGSRFLAIVESKQQPVVPMTMVLNWHSTLGR